MKHVIATKGVTGAPQFGVQFRNWNARPVSVAGVARRTTRRQVYATSVYVASLPPSCTTIVTEGTTVQRCGAADHQSSGGRHVVVNVTDWTGADAAHGAPRGVSS